MAQLTWPSYTPRVALSLRSEEKAPTRRIPLLASRLRWITAAAFLLISTPVVGALATGGATGPPSTAPAAIAQVASQARSVLAVTDYQVTLPLQEAQVLPPPPPPAVAAGLPYGSAFWQAVPEPPAGTIMQIIWSAAQQYDVSYTWLLGVAQCESGLDPTDVNKSSGASGLFQFMPATFHGHGGTDIWDPVQQSDIAAKMFSIGESREWVCK
ncbi:MAG TPA: transglycosylase SLT domain-containing protein [Candidatus Dormibacteraeota bacterium]|nr:transglycosylase SLT domain-containing protein [Candidatus Dormibacteraeota bacterium]